MKAALAASLFPRHSEDMTKSWKITLPCSRLEADAVYHLTPPDRADHTPPVMMMTEPDEAHPDLWRIDLYFDHAPDDADLAWAGSLVSGIDQTRLEVEALADEDWVTMSQAGLTPVTTGRFHVRTPGYPPPETCAIIDLVIPAGLAFGTGQHHTTAGCLNRLGALADAGARFANLLDLGTGTGLLAFAAMKLWPQARARASDIDPVAIDVTRDNALLNHIPLGEAPGQLALVVADGMADSSISRHAPYDLILANILAAPLIAMAPGIVSALAPGGLVILAGLLDHQAEAVGAAYAAEGLGLLDSTGGEWPCLTLKRG